MSATLSEPSSIGLKPMWVDYSGEASTARGLPHPLLLFIAQRRAMPSWWPTVFADVERLSRLPQNWDGNGAAQVDPYDVGDALLFLERMMGPQTKVPRFAPLTSGGVELLWRADNVEVEAVFDRNRGERVLLVEAGEHDWELPLDEADSLFLSVRDRLDESHIPGS
jgi:hypothetical protein